MKKMTFALFLGNRGFFPGELVASARSEMRNAIHAIGCDVIEMDETLTRFGAVETIAEGMIYANWLDKHRGKFDGVILSLPNFGDENGASIALRDANVPILLQAYPDVIGKMDFSHRRDSFCGKISIADVFKQVGIKFTIFEPHTCHPDTEDFRNQLEKFAQVCSIVKSMRRMNVGSIGIRPTAFKTIRYDEIALQNMGINVEAFELLQLFEYMDKVDKKSSDFSDTVKKLKGASDISSVPEEQVETTAKLYLALKQMVKDYHLDALAIRCWSDMQNALKITPCLVNGLLNSERIPVACETDICNSISMFALQSAADQPAICMDWNNNYGDDPDKCIVFHCGNVAPEQMTGKGTTISHKMLDKGKEELGGVAWGCNQGRIKSSPLTYMSCKTENGRLKFYLGEGQVTDDQVEQGYFGVAGVIQIPDLQRILLGVCKGGYRHHVSMTLDRVQGALEEAFSTYLGYDIDPL